MTADDFWERKCQFISKVVSRKVNQAPVGGPTPRGTWIAQSELSELYENNAKQKALKLGDSGRLGSAHDLRAVGGRRGGEYDCNTLY